MSDSSADEFINYALKWFGDKNFERLSAWEKGTRLANFIQKEKTLFILDGMEPLQYPPGQMEGKIKDPALLSCLKSLARNNNGLCVITTRIQIADLENFINSSVKRVSLDNLSEKAGVELLEKLGAKGTDKELLKASKEYKNHALALTLLGRYVKIVLDGDIKKRDTIPTVMEEQKHGGHAKKIMLAYEIWLKNTPELNILYLMGLFDKPADEGAIEALKSKQIKGLTSELKDISKADWKFAIENLKNLGFLQKEEKRLDCHPLIREYFGEKLQKENKKAWIKAHTVLYKYYKALPKKKQPDTIEEMEPLFAAVSHGCFAGKHEEALYDVYWERIRRGNDAYSVKKLGAFGADLACLSNFFESLWDIPASNLSENWKASFLNWAGFGLRALCRLHEAVQPMKAALELLIKAKNWKGAAINANNNSELLLVLGNVKEALKYAKNSVKFADKSGDDFEMESNRTTLADAFHHAGNIKEAEKLFIEAENMQKKRYPKYDYLYSLWGFRYCDLLISFSKYEEALDRGNQALKLSIKYLGKGLSLLDIALDNLTIGKALLLKALQENSNDFSESENFLNKAVDGLREAGTQHHLSRGLIARASLYRFKKEFSKAWSDLDEAKEIIDSGDMKLYLADYHIEAAKLYLSENKKEKAKKNTRKAKKLVEEMGYHRRDGEVAELESVLKVKSN
jgi:tetratricopeptide (TPR) repeat protein